MYHITVDSIPFCQLPLATRTLVEAQAADVVYCGLVKQAAAEREAETIRRALSGRSVEVKAGYCPQDYRSGTGSETPPTSSSTPE